MHHSFFMSTPGLGTVPGEADGALIGLITPLAVGSVASRQFQSDLSLAGNEFVAHSVGSTSAVVGGWCHNTDV